MGLSIIGFLYFTSGLIVCQTVRKHGYTVALYPPPKVAGLRQLG